MIEDGTGDPLQDIYVCSEGVDNGAFNCTTTAADGTYTIGGLATTSFAGSSFSSPAASDQR